MIHGIGRQPPLATLATVAQGWLRRDRAAGGTVRADGVLVRLAGRSHSAVRFSGEGVPGDLDEVDVVEFAWQHLVQGQAGPVRVLAWLLATGLAPLDVRMHWRVLRDAGRSAPAAALVVARQAGIAAALLLVVVGLLVALAAALAALSSAGAPALDAARSLRDELADAGLVGASALTLALTSVALALALGLGATKELLGSALRRRAHARDGIDWAGAYAGEVGAWARAGLVSALLVGAIAVGALAWTTSTWPTLLAASWRLATDPDVALGLASALALGGLASALVHYVGDVALYVTSDTSSRLQRTRAAVKAAGAELLGDLLRSGEGVRAGGGAPRYDAVVVVGHSLGSVIAYDLLNEASRDARAEGGIGMAPLLKLRGLLTFGSPLDKVAYFFRERVGDDASVHAQLLSQRHATKRRPSRRDDGPYALAPYDVPLGWLRWVHLHAAVDPISDPLAFYDVDERHVRPYRAPWSAHGAYWRDPVTYDALDDLLRTACARTLPP